MAARTARPRSARGSRRGGFSTRRITIVALALAGLVGAALIPMAVAAG